MLQTYYSNRTPGWYMELDRDSCSLLIIASRQYQPNESVLQLLAKYYPTFDINCNQFPDTFYLLLQVLLSNNNVLNLVLVSKAITTRMTI